MGNPANKPENLKLWGPFEKKLQEIGFSPIRFVEEKDTSYYVGYQKKISFNFSLIVWTNLYFDVFNVRAEITTISDKTALIKALERMTENANIAANNSQLPELEQLIVNRSIKKAQHTKIHPEIDKVIFQSANGSIISAKSNLEGQGRCTQLAKYIDGISLNELDTVVSECETATKLCSHLR